MKKEAFLIVTTLFFIAIILSLSFIQAFQVVQAAQTAETPKSSIYPFFDKVIDNIKLFFAKGDKEIVLALEIREKYINSAFENIEFKNTGEVIKNLNEAEEKLKFVQEQVSPETANEVVSNSLDVQEVIEKIMAGKEVDAEFSSYLEKHLSEEQKTQLAAQLSEKIGSFCEELAKQDFEVMMKEPKCNPDNAPPWLKDKIEKEFQKMQEEAGKEIIEMLTTCMNDPRECDCSRIPVVAERAECEKGTSLAIKCEFQEDMSACSELEKIGPPKAPASMPFFLKPLFEKTIQELMGKKEKEMFKKFAPKECVEKGATTRGECEKIMMEIYGPPPEECMEDGRFVGEEECNSRMIASGKIPSECIDNGKPLSQEECIKRMVASGKIPSECIESGKPVPEEECTQRMVAAGKMPTECVKDGRFIGREECEKIMQEIHGKPSEECLKDGKFIGEEECQRIMDEKFGKPPQECLENGKPVSEEECTQRMVAAGKMPTECVDNGKFVGQQECERRMIEIGKIPPECVRDGKPIEREECEKIMIEKHFPKECKEANALTPAECEKILLPSECKEAGLFSREECEAFMIKKNMPQECVEANALAPEECSKLMIEKMPSECVVEGKALPAEECGAKMIESGRIPKECVKDSMPLPEEECKKIIAEEVKPIPLECEGKTPEECEEIFKNKINENIPQPCKEAAVVDAEECGKFMEKDKEKEGIGLNMPSECIGKSAEECKEIMKEKGILREEGISPEMSAAPTTEMPQECKNIGTTTQQECDMIIPKINEERMERGEKIVVDKEGNQEYITKEEINKIVDEAEKRAEEIKPDLEKAEEIKQDIVEIERGIERIEQTQQEMPPAEPLPAPEQQPSPETTPAPGPAPSAPAESAPITGATIKEFIENYYFLNIFEKIKNLFS
ncbi:hypothetical protein HZA33_01450 [Candidatus Pacearchaeota archaeon]|nr:hypothetical protein [Candidatus Pacearchaeota archaeon]